MLPAWYCFQVTHDITGVTPYELKSGVKQHSVHARMLCYLLLKKYAGYSNVRIEELFGKRRSSLVERFYRIEDIFNEPYKNDMQKQFCKWVEEASKICECEE